MTRLDAAIGAGWAFNRIELVSRRQVRVADRHLDALGIHVAHVAIDAVIDIP